MNLRYERVCVVGAGISGLQTLRALLKRGLQVLCLEQAERAGGVWARRCHADLRLQVPCELYEFAEFPWPTHLLQPDQHPSSKAVWAYIQAYADHFKLNQHIRFQCQLLHLQLSQEGGWTVIYLDKTSGLFHIVKCDFVVMSTGMYCTPNIPVYKGMRSFSGLQFHAKDFNNSQLAAGKRVLVVGSGRSALDIASMIAASQQAAQIIWLFRQAHWPLLQRLSSGLTMHRLVFSRLPELLLPPYYTATTAEQALHALFKPCKERFWSWLQDSIAERFGLRRRGLLPSLSLEADLLYHGHVLDVEWCRVLQQQALGDTQLNVVAAKTPKQQRQQRQNAVVSAAADSNQQVGHVSSRKLCSEGIRTGTANSGSCRLGSKGLSLSSSSSSSRGCCWWGKLRSTLQGKALAGGDDDVALSTFSGATGNAKSVTTATSSSSSSTSCRVIPVCGDIERFGQDSVLLHNGAVVAADIVIYCTGYNKVYSYLEENLKAKLDVQKDGLPLYRNIWSPAVPDLAFVGCEVSSYNNILTSGLQAEWLAGVLAGDVQLPSVERMLEDVRAQTVWRRRVFPAHRHRSAAVQLYMTQYHAQLLKDLNLAPPKPRWILQRLTAVQHYSHAFKSVSPPPAAAAAAAAPCSIARSSSPEAQHATPKVAEQPAVRSKHICVPAAAAAGDVAAAAAAATAAVVPGSGSAAAVTAVTSAAGVVDPEQTTGHHQQLQEPLDSSLTGRSGWMHHQLNMHSGSLAGHLDTAGSSPLPSQQQQQQQRQQQQQLKVCTRLRQQGCSQAGSISSTTSAAANGHCQLQQRESAAAAAAVAAESHHCQAVLQWLHAVPVASSATASKLPSKQQQQQRDCRVIAAAGLIAAHAAADLEGYADGSSSLGPSGWLGLRDQAGGSSSSSSSGSPQKQQQQQQLSGPFVSSSSRKGLTSSTFPLPAAAAAGEGRTRDAAGGAVPVEKAQPLEMIPTAAVSPSGMVACVLLNCTEEVQSSGTASTAASCAASTQHQVVLKQPIEDVGCSLSHSAAAAALAASNKPVSACKCSKCVVQIRSCGSSSRCRGRRASEGSFFLGGSSGSSSSRVVCGSTRRFVKTRLSKLRISSAGAVEESCQEQGTTTTAAAAAAAAAGGGGGGASMVPVYLDSSSSSVREPLSLFTEEDMLAIALLHSEVSLMNQKGSHKAAAAAATPAAAAAAAGQLRPAAAEVDGSKPARYPLMKPFKTLARQFSLPIIRSSSSRGDDGIQQQTPVGDHHPNDSLYKRQRTFADAVAAVGPGRYELYSTDNLPYRLSSLDLSLHNELNKEQKPHPLAPVVAMLQQMKDNADALQQQQYRAATAADFVSRQKAVLTGSALAEASSSCTAAELADTTTTTTNAAFAAAAAAGGGGGFETSSSCNVSCFISGVHLGGSSSIGGSSAAGVLQGGLQPADMQHIPAVSGNTAQQQHSSAAAAVRISAVDCSCINPCQSLPAVADCAADGIVAAVAEAQASISRVTSNGQNPSPAAGQNPSIAAGQNPSTAAGRNPSATAAAAAAAARSSVKHEQVLSLDTSNTHQSSCRKFKRFNSSLGGGQPLLPGDKQQQQQEGLQRSMSLNMCVTGSTAAATTITAAVAAAPAGDVLGSCEATFGRTSWNVARWDVWLQQQHELVMTQSVMQQQQGFAASPVCGKRLHTAANAAAVPVGNETAAVINSGSCRRSRSKGLVLHCLGSKAAALQQLHVLHSQPEAVGELLTVLKQWQAGPEAAIIDRLAAAAVVPAAKRVVDGP